MMTAISITSIALIIEAYLLNEKVILPSCKNAPNQGGGSISLQILLGSKLGQLDATHKEPLVDLLY